MNRIHRTIWSARLGIYVAVAETSRVCGKSSAISGALLAGVLLASGAHAQVASGALPTGGQVTAGQASIAAQGQVMTVTQTSPRTAINWQGFNIGRDASVQFNQPNASAVVLNRVTGAEGSVIDGTLRANGQVWLVNPNGVLFGRNARVDVGGLVASTRDIVDTDFMAGGSTLRGSSAAGVSNLGQINAAEGGYVALVGRAVRNDGTVTARLGRIAGAAGDQVTLNFNGDSLVGLAVERGTLDALVANGGALRADGGEIVLTAKAASGLVDAVVNNTGELRARTVAHREGRILLLSDMGSGRADVGGTLDASAPDGGNGGFIDTSAANVRIHADARVSTQASAGRNGTWLIDPTDFTISAGSAPQTGSGIGAATLQTALAAGNVTIQTVATGSDVGDIHVDAPVAWNANQLTLEAHGDVNVNSVMTASGTSSLDIKTGYNFNTGAPTFNAANYLRMQLDLAANGTPSFSGRIDFVTTAGGTTGRTGTGALTVNGQGYTLISALGSAGAQTSAGNLNLQGLAHSSNLAGNFALAYDINAAATSGWNSGAGFVPIGDNTTAFSGSFQGLGHSISGLTLNRGGSEAIGLFGRVENASSVASGTVIQGVGVTNASVGGNAAGTLVGRLNSATLRDSWASGGSVGGDGRLGGLIGWASGAVVAETAARVAVNLNNDNGSAPYNGINGEAGGLIGLAESNSNVTRSAAAGAIDAGSDTVASGGAFGRVLNSVVTRSFAIGNVAARGGTLSVGGFAGVVDSTSIQNAYARGNVRADTASFAGNLGGFAGEAINANIGRVYSTGSIGGISTFGQGGLIASQSGSTITNSFWDSTTAGGGNANGIGTSRTTAQMTTDTTFTNASWNFLQVTGTWSRRDGLNNSYPVLRVFGYRDPLTVYIPGPVNVEYGTTTTTNISSFSQPGCTAPAGCLDAFAGINLGSYFTPTLAVGSYAYSTPNAFAPTFVSGAAARSFIITYSGGTELAPVAGTVSVTPRTLTASALSNATRAYDQQTGVAASLLQLDTSRVVNGDSVGLSGSGVLASADVGNQAITASGTLALNNANYQLTGVPTGTVAITPLTLTASASGSRTYDGSVDIAASLVQVSGVLSGDTVAVTGTGALAGANVGSQAVASLGSLASSNPNYALPGSITGTVGITPRTLTVTGSTVPGHVYDATTSAAVSAGTLQGLVGSETLGLAGSALLDLPDAGARTATVSYTLANGSNGGLASNYNIGTETLAATVTPRVVGVTTNPGALRSYDGTAQATAFFLTVNNVMPADVGTLQLLGGADIASRNVGTQAVTGFGNLSLNSDNYTLIGASLSGSLDIVPLRVRVEPTAGATRAYDGTTGIAGSLLSVGNAVAGDTVAISGTGQLTDANVGTRPLAGVGGLSLINNADGNYTLVNGTSQGAVPITPKSLTIAGSQVISRAYDASTTAAVAPGSLQGLVGSQTLGVTSVATLDSANAGARTAQVGYTLGDGSNGGLASNYALAGENLAAQVTPRALAINGTTAADKVYDGNTTAQVSLGSLAGLVSGETLGVTGAGSFDSRNAGARTVSVQYTLADATGLAANYMLPASTGLAATITPRTLGVAAVANASRVYDATATAAPSLLELTGVLTGDTVTLTGAGQLASANVGSRALSLGTLASSNDNYMLVEPTGAVQVTPRTLAVAALPDASRVYDATATAAPSLLGLTGVLTGDTVALTGTGLLASANVGSQAVSLGTLASSNGNYSLGAPTGAVQVTPRTLAVAAVANASRIYDATAVASPSLLEVTGALTGDTVTLTGAGQLASANVGSQALSLGTLASSNGNYALSAPTGSVQVTPRTVAVAALPNASRVYDATATAAPSLLELTGVLTGDTVTLTGAGQLASVNVGSRALSLGTLALSNDNYMLLEPTGAVQVTPRTLAVAALPDASRVYDATATAAPSLLGLTGVLTGDTVALTGSGLLASANVGSQAVSLGTLALSNTNYMLAAPTGAVQVTPRTLAVAALPDASRVYDATATAAPSLLQLTGALTGDTVTLTGAGQLASANVGSQAVSLGTLASSNGNYALSAPTGSVQVTPRTVAVAALPNASRVYDATATAAPSLLELTGVLTGDTVTLTGAGQLASVNVGSRALSLGTLALSNDNYMLIEPTGAVQVTPRTIAVAALPDASRVYDATATAAPSLLGLTGVLTGDTVALTGSGLLASANVGSQAVSLGTLALSNTNYMLAAPTGAVQVTPRTLAVAALPDASRVYDATATAAPSLLQLTGALTGDTVTLTGAGQLASANVGSQAVSLGTLASSNGNYTLAAPIGAVQITPRTLNLSFSVADKVFDGSLVAPATVTDNRVPGDALNVNFSAAYADQNAANGKPVAVTGLSLTGAAAGNYSLGSGSGTNVTGNLLARTVTYSLTANDPTKVYVADGRVLVTPEQVDNFVALSWANTVPGTAPGTVTYTLWKDGVQVSEVRAAGTYVVRAAFSPSDPHYVIASTGNTLLTLNVSDNTIQEAVAQAVRTDVAALIQLPARQTEPSLLLPTPPNVVVAPLALTQGLGDASNLRLVAAPSGTEPSQAVGMTQARSLLAAPGGAAAGSPDVRVPVGRNTLAEIVNGGVRLPSGVDQLLFVVADNSSTAQGRTESGSDATGSAAPRDRGSQQQPPAGTR